jgi:hypothetical protein
MSILRATIVTALLVLPNVLPSTAFARPNDGRFQKSAEGSRLMSQKEACGLYKDMLDLAEKEADKRAGTKAAAPYAKEADSWWEAGVRHGCSWAS